MNVLIDAIDYSLSSIAVDFDWQPSFITIKMNTYMSIFLMIIDLPKNRFYAPVMLLEADKQ